MPQFNPQKFLLKDGREILVRSFTSGDENLCREYIRQIAKESFNTLKYEGMPEMSDEKFLSIWKDSLSSKADLSLGAFYGGELVGYLRFFQRFSTHPWVKHVGCFGLSVKQDFWGLGIASRMLQILDEECRKNGITRIEAEVRTSNDTGVNLYKKNGYKIEGLREKAACINGIYEDEYFIAKILL